MNARDHMERVASIGCIICKEVLGVYTAAEVHHIGASSDRSDWLTIPLCPDHHRFSNGIHGMGERAFNRTFKTTELKLLGLTIRELAHARS